MSQHEIIRSVRDDPDQLNAVKQELHQALPGVAVDAERYASPAQVVKKILQLLEEHEAVGRPGTMLQKLSEVARTERVLRGRLQDVGVWKHVFKKAAFPEPSNVESLIGAGRCNYLFRITTVKSRFIVRYHDPTGKDFLQRHEPRKAATIYGVAADLFKQCLKGNQAVGIVPIRYHPELADASIGNVDDARADPTTLILNRIVVQDDKASTYALLSEGFNPPEIVERLVRSLAEIHRASQEINKRSAPADSTLPGLQRIYKAARGLLRFVDPNAYYDWLVGRNWLWRRLQTLDPDSLGEVWDALIRDLHISPVDLRRLYKGLAEHSTYAMDKYGTLVHLDHAPHNCFARRGRKPKTLLFDFDYVAVADPAYDFGLTLNAMIHCIAEQSQLTFDNLLALLRNALDVYEGILGPHGAEIGQRACAFAGLAMARSLERISQEPPGSLMTPFGVLHKVCARLLACLLPFPGVDNLRDHTYGGSLLAKGVIIQNQRLRVTLLTPAAHLPKTSQSPETPAAEYLKIWRNLVREVLEDHRAQRDTIERGLHIPEYRPRTWYDTIPGSSSPEEQTPEAGGYRVRCHVWKNAPVPTGYRKICVLLPIENGYRRTYQVLASLLFDLSKVINTWAVEFHVCVNFSDDNTSYEVARFWRTLAAVSNISLLVYEIDDPHALGTVGRKNRWLKTRVLNEMLQSISGKGMDEKSVFLHFADDDVCLSPGAGVIFGNIEYLERNAKVMIVSEACYCDEAHGFLALSGAWKRRYHFDGCGDHDRLLNLYGGCMTTTLARLRRVVGTRRGLAVQLPWREVEDEDFGEDSYLTIKANLGYFRDSAGRTAGTHQPAAFARANVLVIHPEEDNVVGFARRYARDRLWARTSIRACDSRDQGLEETFRGMRQDSFRFIEQKIERGPLRDYFAANWIKELRDQIRELVKDGDTIPAELRALRGVDRTPQKTQHQICKDLVNRDDLFRRVLETVKGGGFGFELVSSLERGEDRRSAAFPLMSRQLALCPRDTVFDALKSSSYLYRWYLLAEESLAVVKKFLELSSPTTAPEVGLKSRNRIRKRLTLSTEREQELDAIYAFDARDAIQSVLDNTDIQIVAHAEDWNAELGVHTDKRPAAERRSYAVFLETNSEHLFCRYFPTVGRGTFLQDSPRRLVYMHRLGEELLREVQHLTASAGGDGVLEIEPPKTVYPDLRQALVSYAGPEQRTARGRFLQAFYVQPKIPTTAHRLWKAKMGNGHYRILSESVASFVGGLHGLTYGVRKFLDVNYLQSKDPPERLPDYATQVLRLLVEHLNQLSLFSRDAYKLWLSGGGSRAKHIKSMLEDARQGSSGIGAVVQSIIHQEGRSLNEMWQEICQESTKSHEEGAVGHLGLTARNLSVDIHGKGVWIPAHWGGQEVYLAHPDSQLATIYLPNHSGVSIIDPAVEGGLVLDELISARLSAAVVSRSVETPMNLPTDDESLSEIWKSFLKMYERVFRAVIEKNELISPKEGRGQITNDVMVRLCRVAAFSLLSRYHRRREYNLRSDERTRLVHTCLDLLHYHASFSLGFRVS